MTTSTPATRPETPRLERDESGIAILTLEGRDGHPFILDLDAVSALEAIVESLEDREDIRGLVIRGAGTDVFCAGADVDAIAEMSDPDEIMETSARGQELFSAIEELPFPVVALIHGACMGGGLELALAAHARLVSDATATRLALPEVRLGILPAWGGTTRLPEVIGLKAALPYLLTGRTMYPSRARSLGLALECPPKELLMTRGRQRLEAMIEARHHGHHGGPASREPGIVDYLVDEIPPATRAYLALAERQVKKETRGLYPAPLALLDVLRRGRNKSRETRFRLEREALARLLPGSVSKHLVSIFRRSRPKDRGGLYAKKFAGVRSIRRVGVVGAGVMGRGIAQLLIEKGLEVRLVDPFSEALVRASRSLRSAVEKAVRRRRGGRVEVRATLDRLMLGTDYSGLAAADLIIEAVPEIPSLKEKVFESLTEVLGEHALIASNTSSLSVAALAAHTDRPGRVAGLHFFNPAPKMPLVEVVRHDGADELTLATLVQFAQSIGKTPVLCSDTPAFVVNRLLAPYLLEAVSLLADGAEITTVDAAARGFGLPMGPFALMDTVGLDVVLHVCRHLESVPDVGVSTPDLIVAMADKGLLGKKAGMGFYRYGKRRPRPHTRKELIAFDPTLDESHFAARLGRQALLDRLLTVLAKEGERVLDENIVESRDDLDLATIYGMGFPPWTGGLATWMRENHWESESS